MYVHVELLIEMYADVFGKVVICGPHARQNEKHMEPDIVFDNEKGDFSYRCMTLAMQKYPGFKGISCFLNKPLAIGSIFLNVFRTLNYI